MLQELIVCMCRSARVLIGNQNGMVRPSTNGASAYSKNTNNVSVDCGNKPIPGIVARAARKQLTRIHAWHHGTQKRNWGLLDRLVNFGDSYLAAFKFDT